MSLETVFQGLFAVFTFPTVIYMLIGVLFGLLIGFIPGLGGSFLLAILIPFIYGMEPGPAMAFLLGGHAVCATGGSISAILFNTPGMGPNAATLLDGYPMTQRGEAGRALGAALTSSALGGVFGVIVLILLIPVLRPVVLAFGPPEFFMLALTGICFIAVVGEGPLKKALAAGGFGLLVSFVGYAPSSGDVRYGFGQLYLHDGIKLVPMAIGLFALAEMISLAVRRGSIVDKGYTSASASGKGTLEGIKDVFRHWGLFLRCSALGTFIGIIPGLGGDVACFMAYGHAAQTSKHGESFGKGNIEGVIAPESANNSKEGGSLVPTLGFGIPGSSAMALLLGAFLILDLQPGPIMLTSKLDVVMIMAWTIAVANVVAAGIALISAKHFVKLTFLRGSIMVPLVLVLCTLGAFTTHNSMGDILVALFFGLLGYYMKKYDYSRAVLILGLVLGRITEKNLNLSLRLFGGDFWMRPIALILLSAVVLTLAIPMFRALRRQHRGENRA